MAYHSRSGFGQLGMTFTAQCDCGLKATATAVTMDQLRYTLQAVLKVIDDHVEVERVRAIGGIAVSISL